MASESDQRFLATTRGRIITLLRRGGATVDELAQALAVSDNAVRGHLAALERDRLVLRGGMRKTGGKPAYAYELTPEGELLLSKAYAPVLAQLLDVLSERMALSDLEAVFRAVGRRLGAGRAVAAAAGSRERALGAIAVLRELGGSPDLQEHDGAFLVYSYGCPLGPLVSTHPEVCQLTEALISELVGSGVLQQCERREKPRCRFEIPAQDDRA